MNSRRLVLKTHLIFDMKSPNVFQYGISPNQYVHTEYDILDKTYLKYLRDN